MILLLFDKEVMKGKTKEKHTVKEPHKGGRETTDLKVKSNVEASSPSPRKLSTRSSFSVFLADFKAASSK